LTPIIAIFGGANLFFKFWDGKVFSIWYDELINQKIVFISPTP
jgi:hypothetical protein